MTVPTRPADNAPVDTAWGDAVHDTVVANDIQYGTTAISISASTQGSVTITFPRTFASTPVVVAIIVSTAGGALGLWCQANVVSATQVTLRLSAAASTTIAGVPVHWIAIGPRA
jgi:hypothetical protein